MLHFGELLNAQVEDEVPYSSLKSLLRALNSNHPASSHSQAGFLSQTQSQTQTPGQSELSAPIFTPRLSQEGFPSPRGALLPKNLNSRFEQAAETCAADDADIAFHPVDGEKWARWLVLSHGPELRKLTERIQESRKLDGDDVGVAVNGVIQFLTDRIHDSGAKVDVSFSHVQAIFNELNLPLVGFFKELTVSQFQPGDAVSAVREEESCRSTVVFYSSGFWASLYAEYVTG